MQAIHVINSPPQHQTNLKNKSFLFITLALDMHHRFRGRNRIDRCGRLRAAESSHPNLCPRRRYQSPQTQPEEEREHIFSWLSGHFMHLFTVVVLGFMCIDGELEPSICSGSGLLVSWFAWFGVSADLVLSCLLALAITLRCLLRLTGRGDYDYNASTVEGDVLLSFSSFIHVQPYML